MDGAQTSNLAERPETRPAARGSVAPVKAPLLALSPRPLLLMLPCIAFGIIALGVFREIFLAHVGTGTLLTSLRQFDMDTEGTVPSWYSSIVLLLCAGLLAVVAGLSRREGDVDWKRWSLLAGLFVFMSLDEASAFHEGLVDPLGRALNLSGAFYFAWVLPAIAVVAFLGLYFLPFLGRLPRLHAARFIACGLIYVGGVLGMEMVSSHYAWHYGMRSVSYLTAMLLEESLEIIGVTLFCLALFAYLRARWGAWTVRIE